MKTNNIRNILNNQKIVLIIIAIGIYLSFNSRYFLSFQNITNIFLAQSFEGMIAIGMAMLIILGEIDLSVGSIMAFGSVLAIIFQPYGVGVGIIAGLIGGTLFGILNGLFVTKLKLPSIAVSLGFMIFLKGVVYALTKEHTLTGTNPKIHCNITNGIFEHPNPRVPFHWTGNNI